MSEPEKKVGFASFGQLRKLERQREQEERERRRVATESVPTESVPTPPVPTDRVPTKSVATKSRATPKRTDPSVQSVATPESVATVSDGQWTAYLNEFWDQVVPTLKPVEAIALGQLLRLTVGFKREECLISLPRLAERCHVHKNTLRPALRQLLLRGLVWQEGADLSTANDSRASRFRVNLPAPKVEGPRSVPTKSVPTRSVATESGPMIHDQKQDQSAGIYEIRTVAARLFEAHRGEAGFDHDRLRELVTDVLIGQGRRLDRELIEEAIRHMGA